MLCFAICALIQASRIYCNNLDKRIFANLWEGKSCSSYTFPIALFLLQQTDTVSFERFFDNLHDSIDLLYSDNTESFKILWFRRALRNTSGNDDMFARIDTGLDFIAESVFGRVFYSATNLKNILSMFDIHLSPYRAYLFSNHRSAVSLIPLKLYPYAANWPAIYSESELLCAHPQVFT